MTTKFLCFLILPILLQSLEFRNHIQQLLGSKQLSNQCHKKQKTTKSFNNNCLFRYFTCQQSPNQILSVIDCTYCEGQQNCPYLTYLGEVECIEKCCPFQSFFLSSMSQQRLQSCILFTEMQRQSINWVHNEFFFPFLIALIVLLIIIVIFLLVKTVIHLWNLYVKKKKRNQNQHHDENHDNTTEQNDRIPQWVFQQ